jgi:hypothetical protein
MNFDNSPVKKDDTVYDLIFGAGVVIRVSPQWATVRFGNGDLRSYDVSGTTAALRVRTLFWGDPLENRDPPVKDPAIRAHLNKSLMAVEVALKEAYSM